MHDVGKFSTTTPIAYNASGNSDRNDYLFISLYYTVLFGKKITMFLQSDRILLCNIFGIDLKYTDVHYKENSRFECSYKHSYRDEPLSGY